MFSPLFNSNNENDCHNIFRSFFMHSYPTIRYKFKKNAKFKGEKTFKAEKHGILQLLIIRQYMSIHRTNGI